MATAGCQCFMLPHPKYFLITITTQLFSPLPPTPLPLFSPFTGKCYLTHPGASILPAYLLWSSWNSMTKDELRESGPMRGGRTLWMVEWLRELN